MNRADLIASRLNHLLKELPETVQLVAISKYSPLNDIELAYLAGGRDFGENRVDELFEKANALAHLEGIHWHFIGHLQSKKIGKLLDTPNLVAIHSVDSLRLLEKLYHKGRDLQHSLEFYLQINTSGEEEKYGFINANDLAATLNFILQHQDSPLKFKGLMTMGRIRTDDFERDTRACFQKLVDLKDQLQRDYAFSDLTLSMGMSGDYKIALEYGTGAVRIGSAIFR